MRKMLLSFRPDVYEKIKSGVKIFEHKRNFPEEPIIQIRLIMGKVHWNISKKTEDLLGKRRTCRIK